MYLKLIISPEVPKEVTIINTSLIPPLSLHTHQIMSKTMRILLHAYNDEKYVSSRLDSVYTSRICSSWSEFYQEIVHVESLKNLRFMLTLKFIIL